MDHPAANPVVPSADWLPAPEPPPLPLPPPPAPLHHASFGHTLRRAVQVAAVFLSLFLFIRTFALEPFGVPTGSMANTLLGNHREGFCPRCDSSVRVGQPSTRGRTVAFDKCVCPNCGASVDLSQAPELHGDRLLVDKTVFNARSPRRWEVAVFRCPVDLTKPYVKRVIGLPGEAMQIVDGDVTANGELLRKTLAEVRETRVPFHDANLAPSPDGWAAHWVIEPIEDDAKGPRKSGDAKPVGPDILADGVLTLDAAATPETSIGLTYHHRPLGAKDDEPVRDWLAYNGGPPEARRTRPLDVVAPPVHDFVLECDLEVIAGNGLFACRLGDGGDFATADFPIGETTLTGIRIATRPENGGKMPLPTETIAHNARLKVGQTYHLEFAFVDRRVSLALDGEEVLPPSDLPAKAKRGGVRRPLQLGAQGVSVRVRNLMISRDIHYRTEGRNGTTTPCQLSGDEYFTLGDNTADSHDSREWAVPGVPEASFIGKPFLIHQPMRLGRLTVNGQDKVFQTVDWSRLRWLR